MRLTQSCEEAVGVLFVGIYAETLPGFRLYVHRPTPIIVLKHLHLVEVHLPGNSHLARNVKFKYIHKLILTQLRHPHVLSGKVSIVGTVAQRTVWIVETNGLKALLLQSLCNALFRHSRYLIVNLNRRTRRKHYISALPGNIAHNHHALFRLVGISREFVGNNIVLGNALTVLLGSLLVSCRDVVDGLTEGDTVKYRHGSVYVTLQNRYQLRILAQLTRPILH